MATTTETTESTRLRTIADGYRRAIVRATRIIEAAEAEAFEQGIEVDTGTRAWIEAAAVLQIAKLRLKATEDRLHSARHREAEAEKWETARVQREAASARATADREHLERAAALLQRLEGTTLGPVLVEAIKREAEAAGIPVAQMVEAATVLDWRAMRQYTTNGKPHGPLAWSSTWSRAGWAKVGAPSFGDR